MRILAATACRYMGTHPAFISLGKRSWAKGRRHALSPCEGQGSRRLAADGDGLKLEMAATQQCGCSNELARGQVLGSEVGAVDSVEFVEEREIRTGNLHVNQIVHGHSGLLESGFDLVEQNLDFVVDFGGRLARLIQADAPSQVQRIAGQNAVTEWQLRIGVGQVNGAAAG